MERSDERSIIYEKLPSDIAKRHVLLLDPILATGNSAVEAINILLTRGVPEKHIILVTLICAPKVPQPPAPCCHRSRTPLALSACGTVREVLGCSFLTHPSGGGRVVHAGRAQRMQQVSRAARDHVRAGLRARPQQSCGAWDRRVW